MPNIVGKDFDEGYNFTSDFISIRSYGPPKFWEL
jgi:hypothetical protein